jgi:hypothetical protein
MGVVSKDSRLDVDLSISGIVVVVVDVVVGRCVVAAGRCAALIGGSDCKDPDALVAPVDSLPSLSSRNL